MHGVRALALAWMIPFAAGCAQLRDDDAVTSIASWLEATAETTGHGCGWRSWPDAPPDASSAIRPVPIDLYSGSAGPVLFFAELGARASDPTQRARYVESAQRGAEELLARLPDAAKPGEPCGLYTGIAGIGATLLETGRLLDLPRATAGARRCIALLQQAAEVAGHGVQWSSVTDVIDGGAGIGLFLLAAHEQLGEPLALELALRAGRRLEQLARREPIGRSWEMEPGFACVMPNFAHGTAGVAFFLARLAEVSGATRFLDVARDGADHLLALADRSDGGCRLHHHSPGGEELYYLGWCHGPAGTARLFAQLARQCGDARYGDAARAALRTLLESDLPTLQPGFWNNVGQCCGSAGVIEFLLEATHGAAPIDVEQRADALAVAQRLAEDLLARGQRDARGLSFPQAEQRSRPDTLAAQSGYMQGAAGIDLALLHLEAVRDGTLQARCTMRLPDASFAAPRPVRAR